MHAPKLTNPTDDQLNAAFLTEICGGKIVDREPEMTNKPEPTGRWLDGKFYVASWSRAAPNVKMWHDWDRSSFATSADATLPWLEKARKLQGIPVSITLTGAMLWGVWIGGAYTWDKSFPRAAVIALLRAHGVEVEFT